MYTNRLAKTSRLPICMWCLRMQKVLNWHVHVYIVEKNDIMIPKRFYSLQTVASLNATNMK